MLRKCKDCGIEAHIEKELSVFINDYKCKHNKANLCKKCSQERGKINRSKNKERYTEYYRRAKWKKKYGVDREWYEDRLVEQEGKCYSCGRTPEELGEYLCIDHNHNTGDNRGLLCKSCNLTLGYSKESIEVLENLIKYIKEYN